MKPLSLAFCALMVSTFNAAVASYDIPFEALPEDAKRKISSYDPQHFFYGSTLRMSQLLFKLKGFKLSEAEVKYALESTYGKSFSLDSSKVLPAWRTLYKVSASFNYEVQAMVGIANDMVTDPRWIGYCKNFKSLSYGGSINAFTNCSLALPASSLEGDMSLNFVVGRTFVIPQQSSYDQVRKSFFARDYLTAGNLSLFPSYLITPQAGQATGAGVVILPSTAGISSSEFEHAQWLAEKGIISLIVDTFYPQNRLGLQDPQQSYPENELITVFAARQLLASHPLLKDGGKIGVMGSSRGATMADLACWSQYIWQLSHDDRGFDFQYGYYPTILMQQQHLDQSPTPRLIMAGDQDAFVDVEATQAYVERLRAGGIDANFIVYPGAAHGFESSSSATVNDAEFPVLSMKRAGAVVSPSGYAPLNNGAVPDHLQPHDFVSWDHFATHLASNVIFGFKCAYHQGAAVKSMGDLEVFLTEFSAMKKP